MRFAAAIFSFAALVWLLGCLGCQPAQVTSQETPSTPKAETWETRFKAATGSAYDANSRLDRDRMAVLKGEATPTPKPASTPTPPKPTPTPPKAGSDREKVMVVAASQIGTTEATGHNDGEVVKYLTSVGLKKGDPYCAAFVFWTGREALGASSPYPRSGWSPDMVDGGSLVSKGATGKPADTWGIYFPSLGRVGHTGFVEEWGSSSVVTIEANTSPQAGSGDQRNGDGVWRKRRLKASLYEVKDWVGK